MTTTTALPTLSQGATGPDVRWAQYLMVFRGLNDSDIDGIFGPDTEAGVRWFQDFVGLIADGVVGPLTWAALRGDAPRPPLLTEGSTGPLVATLQDVLNRGRGEFSPTTDPPLATDGVFGPRTARVVRGTQQIGHIPADAVVGLQTWALHVSDHFKTLASLCGLTAPQP
jgi:peptidoglycan hydrolase-like protein with peptidoglycan-binding domain